MRLLLAVLALPLAAQDLYFAPAEYVVAPGQRITAVIGGAGAAPKRLRDAALYTPKGVYNVVGLRGGEGAVSGDATIPVKGTLILAVRAIPETAARERRFSYAKALLLSQSPDDHFRRVAGLTLELIPESDPYRLKVGDRLPLRLLLRGQPAPDAEVSAASGAAAAHPAGRTDSAGRIAVLVDGHGSWRFQASVRERCADTRAADWEVHSTSLSFAVVDPAAPQP